MKKPRFPTKDGVMWKPQGLLWAQMCAVYGVELLEQECPKMNVWLLDHPSKWPTVNGMPRFIRTWMSRAKPQVRTIAQNRPTDAWMLNTDITEGPTPEEIERMRAARRLM